MRKFALGLALMLGACGGSGGGVGGGLSGGGAASPGGVWTGTLTVAGSSTSISGLVDEAGRGAFFDGNGNIYRGTGSVSGNTYNGNYKVFSNASSGVTATVTAVITERSSLSVTTSNSAGQSGSGSATFDPVYNVTPSFSSIAGTYQFSLNGVLTTVVVASNGTFSGSDSSGCTNSGSFSITDPLFNAYTLSGAITCPGGSAAITGLAFYRPAAGSSPATLTAEYDNGSTVAVVAQAPKQ